MEIDLPENQIKVSSKVSGASAGSRAVLAPTTSHNANKGRAIEDIYQKKTQLEHILLRPDTYIGSTEKQQQLMWVHTGERMMQKQISYVPGLYKIFDEILVNAADNKVRDPKMDTLKVDINPAENSIKVYNNGDGIPVEVHKGENVYVPELIFGHLLTSSNYDDNEKKITGGRNGYGAKLANIFSTEFIIETCDGKRERKYKQVFKNNMGTKNNPSITNCKSTDNHTCVTFKPDLAKFGMEELEEDTVMLMRKRVYDLAGILGKTVKVYLDGKRISVKSFSEYVDLYLGPKDSGPPRIYERVNDRWEVCISMTDGHFEQVSFVNSICTYKGGTHVNYITDQISKTLTEMINKKNKQANVKPFMVKNYLWVFLNCQVVNPTFDSQTKENLTLRASSFGSKCELSDGYIKKVANCGVMEHILSYASFKQNKELKKSDGAKRQRLTGIPKLDDANDAGGRNSENCTLILTEGDSAKALAISGLSVVGRDRFGVFPLRGKLLNVRDASATQVTNNAEIQNIKQILGLQHGKVYDSTKQLRYGHLMIMTDQDHDGSHIKGLIMNFFHHFYPSLLKIPGFLVEFITPIIKASKGRETISFYTMPEYEAWKESLGGNTRGWSIKYYKGLGTSTSKEAKEYFAAIQQHRKQFVWQDDHDDISLEMAFSKKKVEERKTWLANFASGTFLDHTVDTISYKEFVHKELILFSRADLERSIPCMLDGLKPGQRKILYSCFKRNLKKDVKVAQLAGYVSEHSAYHHGEQSLAATIVGLAQDFVGSNNVNLLVPSGQFGTRLQGGKDAASPRYIFTRLSPVTRHLFHEADDPLLNYLNEEGQSIEPQWYMPILPNVLVNGAEGIGTGWSTSIPNYNPRDIVDNIKRMLNGEDPVEMMPWYKGFNGEIQEIPSKTAGKSYAVNGIIEETEHQQLHVSELPVRKWTQDYKEYLETLVKPEDKNATPLLLDYKEHHTDTTVDFTLMIAPDKLQEARTAGLHSKFKLTNKISCGNMVLFNAEGNIQRYASPEHILKDFYDLRLDFYAKRKAALLKSAEAELKRINNKVRFIMMVVNEQLLLNKRKKADIEAELQQLGFDKLPAKNAKGKRAAGDDDDETEEEASSAAAVSYEYLLSMPLSSLTYEKVKALEKEAADHTANVERLRGTNEKELWRDDLDAFLTALDIVEAEEAKQAVLLVQQQRRADNAGGRKGKTSKKKAGSDDDLSEDDWMPAAKVKRAPAKKAESISSGAMAAPPAAAGRKRISKKVADDKPAASSGTQSMDLTADDGDDPLAAAAPSGPSNSLDNADAVPQMSDLSLGARLAGRLNTLQLGPSSSSQGKPARGRGSKNTKKLVPLIESDDDEVSSPVVVKPAGRGRGAGASRMKKGSTAAVAGEGGKPPPKRKPAASKPSAAPALPSAPAAAQPDPASPAVAPQGKVRRIRPSPFHKGSGDAKQERPKFTDEVQDEDNDDEDEVSVPAGPQQPRARREAAKKPQYVIELSSDEEVEDEEASDYAPSD